MNYSQYVTTIGTLLQYQIVDASSATPFLETDANNILPSLISYAELRLYREMDFISTIVAPTTTTTSGIRTIITPPSLIVLQSMNIITPAGKTPDQSGSKRNAVQRTSIEYINATYPTVSITGLPEFYAYTQIALTTNPNPTTIALAQTPDATYTVECLGTARPAALSSTNTSTFLTLNMPDIFIAASMVYGAGFQRDYGQQSDDPQLAQSWESQYQILKSGLSVEELRKKAQSVIWQPYSPSQLAQRS